MKNFFKVDPGCEKLAAGFGNNKKFATALKRAIRDKIDPSRWPK